MSLLKRIVSAALCIGTVFVAGAVMTQSASAATVSQDGDKYTIEVAGQVITTTERELESTVDVWPHGSGLMTVTGIKKVLGDGVVVIPKQYEAGPQTYDITRIGMGIHQIDYADNIKHLIVLSDTMDISSYSLHEEGNLLTVDLARVQHLTVGHHAFARDMNVETVSLPADIDSNTVMFDDYAFYMTGCLKRANMQYYYLRKQGESSYTFTSYTFNGGLNHFYDSNMMISGYDD